MSADEAKVMRLMTQMARQELAGDAKVLDLHFDKGTHIWQASALSKKAGVKDLIAEQVDGKWQVKVKEKVTARPRGTTKLNPKDIEAQRTYSHATFDSPLKSLGKLAGTLVVLVALAAAVLVAKPYVEHALQAARQQPADGADTAQTAPAGGEGMMGAAERLANDPKARAAAEKVLHQQLAGTATGKNLQQLQELQNTH